MISPVNTKSNSAFVSNIIIQKTIEATINEAWSYWTNPVQLKSWLTNDAKVELSVGGLYELFWDLDHPEQNSTVGCKIIDLLPLRQISFQWKGPLPFADVMNIEPIPTWVKVTLSEKNNDQTIVRLEHYGWKTDPHWAAARDWQENAWRVALSRL